jgi:NAD(P)-dependent dehydrogenase (short-subunit alcohol dehydrogenase family)
MRLTGKKIVITGGSRGLGKALAQRFAREGATLALCARQAKALESITHELREINPKTFSQRCDIGDPHQVQEFVHHVIDKFEGIDVLVNNASAIAERKAISEYSVTEWENVIQTNVNGLFYVTRAFLPFMAKRKSGAIINVSSSVGRAARARWGAYAVSKYGLEGFTQILAEELRQFNISVNSVNPGPMATEMRRIVHPDEDQNQLRKPEILTEIFVYLASDDGKGITGQQFDASTYIEKPQGIL